MFQNALSESACLEILIPLLFPQMGPIFRIVSFDICYPFDSSGMMKSYLLGSRIQDVSFLLGSSIWSQR